MLLRFLTIVGLLGFATGCGGSAPEDVGTSREPITGGEPSPSGNEDGVILLRITGLPMKSECSASLIAQNLALTARHCVAPLIPGRFSCTTGGELVDLDSGAGGFEPEYSPENIAFFDASGNPEPLALGRKIVSTRPVDICMNDIALVVLDRDVDAPVMTIRRTAARKGDVVTMVGFGATSQEEMLDTLETRRRKTGVVINRVGPDSLFDGEGTVAPRMFAILGPFACRGDSGGPALSEEDGGIVGVYSTQRGERCEAEDVENHFVHVPPYERLLAQAFAEAGATPVFSDEPEVEPEPPAAGEPPPDPPSSEPAGAARSEHGGCVMAAGASARAGWIALLIALAAGARRRAVNAVRRADRERGQRSSQR